MKPIDLTSRVNALRNNFSSEELTHLAKAVAALANIHQNFELWGTKTGLNSSTLDLLKSTTELAQND